MKTNLIEIAILSLVLSTGTCAEASESCIWFNCDESPCDSCDEVAVSSGGWIDDILLQRFPNSPLSVDVLYTTDAIANTRGGLRTGEVYSGLLDLVFRTDLSALGLDRIGGDIVLHGQNSHGGFLRDLVGGTQSNNIDAPPFTAMAEYYWERELLDGNGVVRIGRQVGAIEFSVLDVAADFLWGGFIISPNNPVPWYPNPTVGITGNVQLTDSVNLALGSFNGGAPDQLSPWGWSRNGQVYSVAELTYSYSLGGRPGDIQNGFWYSSGRFDDPAGGQSYVGNYGYYFGSDQMLFAEQDPAQGLAAFFIYSYAPENRNVVEHHFAAGAVYRGLLPGRDNDVLGVGVSTVDFSTNAALPANETVVELFYKTWLGGRILVQPALQILDNPSGVLADSLTAGARLGFEL